MDKRQTYGKFGKRQWDGKRKAYQKSEGEKRFEVIEETDETYTIHDAMTGINFPVKKDVIEKVRGSIRNATLAYLEYKKNE